MNEGEVGPEAMDFEGSKSSEGPTNRGEELHSGAHGKRTWEMPEVEPWPARVDGIELLDELEGVMKRFAVLPQWAAEALALWTVHTYAFELRDVSTYLGIESPVRRCGKSTVVALLGKLANRPLALANITSAAVYWAIEEKRPTLLIDEADTFLPKNDELRGILNAGYCRETAFVVRVSAERLESKVQSPMSKEKCSRLMRFSCWCPKVISMIGHLPETLADRCVVIRMQRKAEGEKCERHRIFQGAELKRKCTRFVKDHAAEIAKATPALPEALNDRAADIWEPLLALAEIAGGHWPEKARRAAVGLTCRAQENSPGEALLADIERVFATLGTERIFSRTLMEELKQMAGRPWAEGLVEKALNEVWLAQQLRPHGVRTRSVRIDGKQAKGYLREDFVEVFRRYGTRGVSE